jgi:hypothetical protein
MSPQSPLRNKKPAARAQHSQPQELPRHREEGAMQLPVHRKAGRRLNLSCVHSLEGKQIAGQRSASHLLKSMIP